MQGLGSAMHISPSIPSIPGRPHEQHLKNLLNFLILQVNWNLWFVLPRGRGTTERRAFHLISFTSAGHWRGDIRGHWSGAHVSHVPGHHSINWCLCRWRHKMCHHEECNSNRIMHSVVEFLTNGQKHPQSVFIMIRAQSIFVLFWSKHVLFVFTQLGANFPHFQLLVWVGKLGFMAVVDFATGDFETCPKYQNWASFINKSVTES